MVVVHKQLKGLGVFAVLGIGIRNMKSKHVKQFTELKLGERKKG